MKLNLKIEKPKKEEIVEPKNQVRSFFIQTIKDNFYVDNIEINEDVIVNTTNKIDKLSIKDSSNKKENKIDVKLKSDEIKTKDDKKDKMKLNINDLVKKELLGNGVSGQVYKAELNDMNFALKIIPYKEDEKFKKLIENEIRALHQCKCDYLIKCYASYILDNSVNIVLEFMDKGTLTDVLKLHGKIPENILGVIALQILEGINYLHKQKIIHRDIKPSNILVNSKGKVKISDFGVSGYVKDTLGNRETMVGTYMYMAPERIKNLPYTLVSDIWSVGISLMECAYGGNPFIYGKKKNDKNEKLDFWVLSGYVIDDPPKLNRLEFSEDFCDFIDCCLIKNPDERYNTEALLNHKFIQNYKNVSISEFKNWLKSK